MSEDTCRNCRFHSVYKRPRILENTGFGDQLMFADAESDEEVFSCKAPVSPKATFSGQEIGLTPVSCVAWQPLRILSAEQRAELDRSLARFEERAAKKEPLPGDAPRKGVQRDV